jgi:hypothetical protein
VQLRCSEAEDGRESAYPSALALDFQSRQTGDSQWASILSSDELKAVVLGEAGEAPGVEGHQGQPVSHATGRDPAVVNRARTRR